MSTAQRKPLAQDGGVKAVGSVASWLDEAEKRLRELRHLPIGWDGHDGKPLDPLTSMSAADILISANNEGTPMPAIMPLSCGGLQVEWHRNGWDVEIEILSPDKGNVYASNFAQVIEDEFPLDGINNRLNPIFKLIK